MSAADGMHSFSANLNHVLTDPIPVSIIRRRDDAGTLNPPMVVRGGLVGGFPDQSPVFLSRSLDLFSDRGSASVDEEPNVVTPVNALAVQPETPETPGTDVVCTNRPDWLPTGWLVEIKVRSNGATAGTRDRYFFDPVSKRRFRSRKEVFSFLATGTLGRYKPKNRTDDSDASLTGKNNSGDVSSKRKKFDRFSRPAKVKWVLDGDGSWSPFIGKEALSESTKMAWMDALDLHGNESSPFAGMKASSHNLLARDFAVPQNLFLQVSLQLEF